jgi:hypothetical protein
MKKLLVFLALVILVSMTGCSLSNPTSQTTTGSTTTTTTTSTTPSGATTTNTIEPIWVPTNPPTYTDDPAITELPAGLFFEKPVPFGQSAINQDGIEITVLSYVTGDQAWDTIKNANAANLPSAADAQYVLITMKIKNVSSHGEPYQFYGTFFDLIAGTNKVYRSRDTNVNVILPSSGQYQKLEKSLNHGDEYIGSVYFYILKGESKLTLVWSNINNNYQLFFAVS